MFAEISTWVQQPFKEQMDLLHWALFVIVILSIAYLWNDVLSIMIVE